MIEFTIASELVASPKALSMREHALGYAQRGWSVLRLVPRGKNPMTPNGLHNATTNLDTIDQWWSEVPDANIGVRPPEGYVVLDVDPRSGGDLDELEPIRRTLMMLSGGGGAHLWYRLPCEGRVRGALTGARGIDVKSNSGYLVMPPSLHPDGGRYEVVVSKEIAVLPEHLVGRVVRLPEPHVPTQVSPAAAPWLRPRGSFNSLIRVVLAAEVGQRNNVLYWATCRALDEDAGEYVLDLLADAAARNGLDPYEIEATMNSARQAPARVEVAR
ncbi:MULTISPECIES: bifunctional DNA primase/polymerase [unclassified Dietzia]|uniref:bifunctional DNA primase/polymerase n=1 Tax=unclassified Dietzia TaxID=2617939 RepID=UPI000BDF9CB2|nr:MULTISPECIES: bifunctional DNA primase/polymerase [unclassified Dietzia]